MRKHVKNNVYWVGKTDWELRTFHGYQYSTHKGSTYNAYLIEEEKTVLIDTVWLPFADEFVDNLAEEIELEKIDYIVINHGEVDHSGALVKLMERIPNTPIYYTATADLEAILHAEYLLKTALKPITSAEATGSIRL